MIRKIGQIQGNYYLTRNLYSTMVAKYPDIKKIIKMGFQLEKEYGIRINRDLELYMGKTETLEYDNIELEISDIRIFHIKDTEAGVYQNRQTPVFIDFIYETE